MTDYIQVLTTAPNKEAAQTIADALLHEKLAACVQIVGPIESRYWWQGKLETVEEWQCLAKSSLHLYTRLEETIRRVHPYEVPEILVTRIETGHAAYLDWLQGELKGGQDEKTITKDHG
jgi:periplasmic divalent cation tolerance protein